MLTNFKTFQGVHFREHPVPDYMQVEPEKFDIISYDLEIPGSFIINNQFSLKHYCFALLFKACSIQFAETEDFIDYQISLLKNPVHWLSSFENLIIENFNNHKCPKDLCILNNLKDILRDKKKELKTPIKLVRSNWSNFEMPVNSQSQKVKFDFHLVKFDLKNLLTFNEKKAYLIDLMADYLQSGKIHIPENPRPLDELIEIELDRLEKIELIKINNNSKKSNLNASENHSIFKVNGNVNVLADAFFQMVYEIKVDGLPYLPYTPTDIANHIINHFLDKDGQKISMSTVQTYLSPKKADKRPSQEKRVKLMVNEK